jgi:acetylornithine deacetylase
MDIVPLTRKLVDIESTTGNEGQVGYFLLEELRRLGYNVQRMVAEGERANVYATAPQQPQPKVAFSTHMDHSRRVHEARVCVLVVVSA